MAHAPRDNISVAFSQSQYPTPYGDNTIPGNHPGVRQRHMGRAAAPYPDTSLNTALEVRPYPYDPHAVKEEAVLREHLQEIRERGDMNHSKEPSYGGRYILNSTNGGRRHYNEERSGEQVWAPSKAYVPPPGQDKEERLPRKGKGVYNYGKSDDQLTQQAQTALQRREERTQNTGRQYVVPPPDHNRVQLGMANLFTSGHTAATTAQPEAAPVKDGSVDILVIEDTTSKAAPSRPAEPVLSRPQETFSTSTAPVGYAPGRSTYVSSSRPQPERMEYKQESRAAKQEFKQSVKREKEYDNKRTEVETVRNLPNW
ncbi:hypothetical protein AGDE_10312 [Angomonas deanei]|nr:hypothetical protein AGDE_10312 [Angomonas deanei]|eukprot:EPY28728.1 hypothetical protein AGDE_10312 [Angomonas deanei]